jgi:hypothetical protein
LTVFGLNGFALNIEALPDLLMNTRLTVSTMHANLPFSQARGTLSIFRYVPTVTPPDWLMIQLSRLHLLSVSFEQTWQPDAAASCLPVPS